MQQPALRRPVDSLDQTITNYWDERAQSYSNGVNDELDDWRRRAWETVIDKATADIRSKAAEAGRPMQVADLGCGPGFFSALMASKGCAVDAIDSSSEMLARAQSNVNRVAPESSVTFNECDLLSLPFEDNRFDLCISRNVTWLMRDPRAAYTEWLRVLRPGGKLIVFDANWYRYLVDPIVDAQRRIDQENNSLDDLSEDSLATSCEEQRCESIAMALPLTSIMRPVWDLEMLASLGVTAARSDEDVWQRLWTTSEQAFYASSPLFMIEAIK